MKSLPLKEGTDRIAPWISTSQHLSASVGHPYRGLEYIHILNVVLYVRTVVPLRDEQEMQRMNQADDPRNLRAMPFERQHHTTLQSMATYPAAANTLPGLFAPSIAVVESKT